MRIWTAALTAVLGLVPGALANEPAPAPAADPEGPDPQVAALEDMIAGRGLVPLGRLMAIDADELLETADVSFAAYQDDPDAQVTPEPEKKEWESNFDLGYSGSFGNTDTQNLRIAIGSKRETESMVTRLEAVYLWGSANNDTNENRFFAGIVNDWLIPDSRWFFFADGRYDFDDFNSWRHRVSAHAGPGYQIIDEDDVKLSARAGAGVLREWESMNDDLQWEAMAGFDLDWDITAKQKLKLSSYIFPSISEGGEFRTTTALDWSVLLDEEAALSLVAGLYWEYQSQVDPGFSRNDLKLYAGVRFSF